MNIGFSVFSARCAQTYLLARKDPALPWRVSLELRQRWAQISPRVSGTQLHTKQNRTQSADSAKHVISTHGQTPHPLSGRLFHRQGTLSGPAGRTGLLCSSSGFSWNCEAHGTSRSRPGRPPPFWGECIARWRAAPLCLHVAERQTQLLMSQWM